MLSEIINNKKIQEKSRLLQMAEKQLKEEFVGIDSVIEDIITNIRPWFLYPETQDKPLILSLVGLSGNGKTSLVNRLVELIEYKEKYVYFNFAEIGEMKTWEVEESFEQNINNGVPNKIFVYDEFQHAATIDEMGGEKDNRNGQKPFWELMDTGILHRRFSNYMVIRVKRILDYANRINSRCPIKLKDGIWENAKECMESFSDYEVQKFAYVFHIPKDDNDERDDMYMEQDEQIVFPIMEDTYSPKQFFLLPRSMEFIRDLYSEGSNNIDAMDFHNLIVKMSFDKLCDFLDNLIKKSEYGYEMDFSKSLIFVIMNLDEAYEMSFNVNPDMLPDQFHKITEKLTIVDIKEALKKRFRNEQIARLGNLFMIYPSFSEDAFRKIITLFLTKYANAINQQWGIKIEFDDTLKDLIYRDSVFPTHGTRPIISSIHEITKTKFPLVVNHLGEQGISDVDSMVYSYTDGKLVIKSYYKNELVDTFEVEQALRLDNHRQIEDREKQALIAVHESGHFVMYTKLYGKTPEKVCSSTVDKSIGGFMLKDEEDYNKIQSKEDCMNEIKISLGGYVAEEMVFGKMKRTTGAMADLKSATLLASTMIRRFGFGASPEVTTYLTGEGATCEGMLIKDDSNLSKNTEIRNVIDECLRAVANTFREAPWKKMLKDSALYLSENTNMPKHKMEELYNEVPENYRAKPDEEYYQNMLRNF